MRSQSVSVVAIGFWSMMSLPARAAATARSVWASLVEQIVTAVTSA